MKQILVLRVQWSNISGTSAIKQILVLRVQLSNKCTNYLNLLLAKCYAPELIVARETIDSITDCFIFGEKVGLQVRTKIRQVRYWLYCQRKTVPVWNHLWDWKIVQIGIFQRHQREIIIIISCASDSLIRDRGKQIFKGAWQFIVWVVSGENRLVERNQIIHSQILKLFKSLSCVRVIPQVENMPDSFLLLHFQLMKELWLSTAPYNRTKVEVRFKQTSVKTFQNSPWKEALATGQGIIGRHKLFI